MDVEAAKILENLANGNKTLKRSWLTKQQFLSLQMGNFL